MNALLVYPELPGAFWSFEHALKFIRKRASLPPLGLLTVAAMLPQGWNRRLVDMNVQKLAPADLAWADLVLISAMIAQRDSARALIAQCRAAGKTIVAGGPLFITEHEQFPGVDHFVLNEAEETLPAFLRDFEQGRAERIYASAAFPDLRRTPTPAWELVNLRHYASTSIQFSRGCPFDCDFCNVTTMLGHQPRTKTPEQICHELDRLYQLGWRGPVFFVDDNLIGNKRYLKKALLPALIEWRKGKHPISFYTEASINLADDEALLHSLVEAGFETVFIGLESPDDDALRECNKRQNRDRDLLADVKRIQRAGLQVQGGFIIGFDSDTPSIFQRQQEFIQRSGIVTAMVGLLNAVPSTRLYDRLKREGRLLRSTTGNNVDGTMNFIPRMGARTLLDGYRDLLRHIYAPGPYYQRMRTFLREYRPPRMRLAIDWSQFWAFVHANVRLGVFGPERFHYWRLLLWTLFQRPALMRIAVTLAIYGHHFRKTCQAILG
jgi:radical SAM superfamily enzyme YgiQ (UPF0313 family)